MSDVYSYLWLIPALPLLAAVVTTLFGRQLGERAHAPCVLAVVIAAILSFGVLLEVLGKVPPKTAHTYFTWFAAGTPGGINVEVPFALRADALSAIMLVTVTFIGSLIAIYSIGYMHDDPGYPRFFAAVALFIAAMTLLVSGDNLLLLFTGWEGVGLCSYLLIGFWFNKPAAADAAKKAFLVNRIGDFGFMIGILMAWVWSGYQLSYDAVFRNLTTPGAGPFEVSPLILTVICLLLFCGAAGKSAQFPLHVWLPDAMEGPTPVSALIHAATMVTAGVYMVARCTPLYRMAPDAQIVVACIGGFTALLAALIALTQTDLKRILAYSTLSQLGYMFLALGSAVDHSDPTKSWTSFAVIAAIFHLFTHAFFKALLFLGAGSVMHAMGGVIDLRRFGGLMQRMPRTHATFLIGSLTLAGFPLLSGFWSKDEILASTLGASAAGGPYATVYLLLFLCAVATAFLTAFYSFRAYFLTFWGPERIPEEAGHHAHESPPVMTVPLMILAFFSLFVGFALGPKTHLFEHLLQRTPGFPPVQGHGNLMLMLLSSVVALGGIGLAYFFYVEQPDLPGKVARGAQALYQLSLNKFGFDELYIKFIVLPVMVVAEFCRVFDQYVVDGLVDLIGETPRLVGGVFKGMQNGLVQSYALAMMIGVTALLLVLAFSL